MFGLAYRGWRVAAAASSAYPGLEFNTFGVAKPDGIVAVLLNHGLIAAIPAG
jgi:hypothetical protein